MATNSEKQSDPPGGDSCGAEPRLDELKAALTGGERLLILTHDNPDPDALASAFGLYKLVETLDGVTARIAFGGFVGRAENRTMVHELGLPITPTWAVRFDDVDIIALVDTQPGTGNNSLPDDRQADIVIDHHPIRKLTKRAKFWDVRTHCGSSCTIVTQYLEAAGVPLKGRLATALFYGIQSETQDLGREACEADLQASLALYPGVNREVISRIRYPDLPPAYFRSLHRSLERSRLRGPVIISYIGKLDYPDLVAELADFYLRLKDIKWSFCIGVFEDAILISVRTSRRDAAAGQLLRRVVGKEGAAGGHGMMAGARIPIGHLSAEDQRLKSEELVNRFIKELGVEDETGGALLDTTATGGA
ncbi:MAG TPA: bifunctional oligoribonuclease/PAP phosphatase NrnA [Gemmatimonadota bacterium]|nr:bifunctional oligoribonuclease/PAP phosphatase NrnA [Gemmatimonadota bacterium]